MEGEHRIVRDLANILDMGECIDYDACPFNNHIIVNMDGYALEYSRYPFLSLEDWGYRGVAAAASDVIASGGTPKAILYSIGVRNSGEAYQVARGVAAATRDLGVRVLKSDLNKASRPWIDVAVIGVSRRPVSRRGASEGELVVQAGYMGYGLLEYLVYKGEIPLDEARRVKGFGRRLPPRVEDIISRYATASSDNSDGWIATLRNIALSSGASILLDDLILDSGVEGLLEKYGFPSEDGLKSWEDYNIAFTIKREHEESVLKECSTIGVYCRIVGRVTRGPARIIYMGRELDYGWEWL